MARVAFPLVLQSPSTGSAITGATATITQHVVGQTPGTGPQAPIYLSETGSTAVSGNQIQTDTSGRWTQGSAQGFAQYWLPQGTYDIQISGEGLTAYAITRELFSAGQSDEVALAGQPIWWPGPTVPSPCVAADGLSYSRTGYPAMFANLTVSGTATANGTTTLSNVSAAIMTALARIAPAAIPAGLAGIPISGPNVPSAAHILGYNAGAGTITLDKSVASGTGLPIVVAPHGVGDGSTTFNVPDLRFRVPIGVYPGASAAGNANYLGQVGGEEAHTLGDTEMPSHIHGINDNGHGHGVNDNGHSHSYGFPEGTINASGGSQWPLIGTGGSYAVGSSRTGISIQGSATGVTVQAAGGGGSHNNVQPYVAGLWVIRHGLQ